MLIIFCSVVFLLVGYFFGAGRGAVVCLKCLLACVIRLEDETTEMTNGAFFVTRFLQIIKEDFPELHDAMRCNGQEV